MKKNPMIKRTVLLAGALLALPALASAYDGFVTANVNMRAGPAVAYPAVTMIPSGSPVSIYGCLDGWTWCDVSAGPNRGWVAANFVQDNYQGRRVVITDYGSQIGIPVVTFALGTYWDNYYRARPWYRERTSWENRRIAHAPPPRAHGPAHPRMRQGDSRARISPAIPSKVIERADAGQARSGTPVRHHPTPRMQPDNRAHIPASTPAAVINRTAPPPTPDQRKKDDRDRR